MDIDILATFDICFLNEHGANVMYWIGFLQVPDSLGAKFISSLNRSQWVGVLLGDAFYLTIFVSGGDVSWKIC